MPGDDLRDLRRRAYSARVPFPERPDLRLFAYPQPGSRAQGRAGPQRRGFWRTCPKTRQKLRHKIAGEDARPVRLPPGRARLQAARDRVDARCEYDRDCRGRSFRCDRARRSHRRDHIYMATDQVGGQRRYGYYRGVCSPQEPVVFEPLIPRGDRRGGRGCGWLVGRRCCRSGDQRRDRHRNRYGYRHRQRADAVG